MKITNDDIKRLEGFEWDEYYYVEPNEHNVEALLGWATQGVAPNMREDDTVKKWIIDGDIYAGLVEPVKVDGPVMVDGEVDEPVCWEYCAGAVASVVSDVAVLPPVEELVSEMADVVEKEIENDHVSGEASDDAWQDDDLSFDREVEPVRPLILDESDFIDEVYNLHVSLGVFDARDDEFAVGGEFVFGVMIGPRVGVAFYHGSTVRVYDPALLWWRRSFWLSIPFKPGWFRLRFELSEIRLILKRGGIEDNPGPPKHVPDLVITKFALVLGADKVFSGSSCGYNILLSNDPRAVGDSVGSIFDKIRSSIATYPLNAITWMSYRGKIKWRGVCPPSFSHGFSSTGDVVDSQKVLFCNDFDGGKNFGLIPFSGSRSFGVNESFVLYPLWQYFHFIVDPLNGFEYEFEYTLQVDIELTSSDGNYLLNLLRSDADVARWKVSFFSHRCVGIEINKRVPIVSEFDDFENGESINHFLHCNCFIHTCSSFLKSWPCLIDNFLSHCSGDEDFRALYSVIKSKIGNELFAIDDIYVLLPGSEREVMAGAIIQFGLDRGEIGKNGSSYVFVSSGSFTYDPVRFELNDTPEFDFGSFADHGVKFVVVGPGVGKPGRGVRRR